MVKNERIKEIMGNRLLPIYPHISMSIKRPKLTMTLSDSPQNKMLIVIYRYDIIVEKDQTYSLKQLDFANFNKTGGKLH